MFLHYLRIHKQLIAKKLSYLHLTNISDTENSILNGSKETVVWADLKRLMVIS